MYTVSRSASRSFENYVFLYIKRNTQLLFHTSAEKDPSPREHTYTDFSTLPDYSINDTSYLQVIALSAERTYLNDNIYL
jgi:hypothetical protein